MIVFRKRIIQNLLKSSGRVIGEMRKKKGCGSRMIKKENEKIIIKKELKY